MARPEKAQEFTQTTFGFRQAGAEERTHLVGEVFKTVASRYDLMNDVMSLGVHRLWKADFIRRLDPRPGEKILDLAGGTGDIAFAVARAQGGGPGVTVCDINPEMLEVGRRRAADRGFFGKIEWVEGNAEDLPFDDAAFDAVTIAFGLRNVTRIGAALGEALRVLKPGGRFFCLEFSRPALPVVEKLFERYSFSVIPWLGQRVVGDSAPYKYLAESIRKFPEQEKLAKIMREAGFSNVRFRNLSLGVVAVHSGWKA